MNTRFKTFPVKGIPGLVEGCATPSKPICGEVSRSDELSYYDVRIAHYVTCNRICELFIRYGVCFTGTSDPENEYRLASRRIGPLGSARKKPMNAFLSTLSLRTKLLLGFLLTFLVSVVLGNLIIFMVVHKTIETNIEKELINTNNIIMNMVKSASDASIKNHLRAVAEKNHDIVQHFYDEFRHGRISEKEAKKKATEVLLSQTIGKTGYIYSVDSKGVLRVHPKISGTDLSKYDFIRQQVQLKAGYLEYEWANPGEKSPRKKALYMTYFGPWDWIISVSSYREEFKDLFKVSDFRDDILAVSFGKTGYPYVMDSKGNLIIHPKLQGQNIFESKDSNNREFIKEIIAKKVGKIVYAWQNPDEIEPRDKLAIFNYIPEFDWIVASSSYLEEFNGPLMTIGYVTLLTLGLVILLVVPITWYLSSSINKPIKEIMHGFSLGAKGDYSSRIENGSGDELGQLAAYYNDFMEKLSESTLSLHASEEKFRLLFENAVEGVFTMAPDGKFLSVNPSMARMLGYENRNSLLREVGEITDSGAKSYVEKSEKDRLMSELLRSGTVTGFETTCLRRDGSTLWVSVNARAITDASGSIVSIDGFCSDVTAKKKAQEAQNKIKKELEQRVIERTAELSSYISKLEQRTLQETLFREMGELLQMCGNTCESFAIVNEYVGRFFPGCSGALFLFDVTRSRLEEIVSWGPPDGSETEFGRNDCWALRQGKLYSVSDDNRRLICNHVHEREHLTYLCVPLIALGEVLGLLHIQPQRDVAIGHDAGTEVLQGLATTFTNNLGLALANLKLQDRLRDQSIKDPLTGLFNRRFMEEFAEQEIRKIKRHNTPFSIFMIDVDNFKKFNDTYGHDAGDLVLKELAGYFWKYCRESDVACRYGGEEFVIVLPVCEQDDAVSIAQRLCNGVREKLRIAYREEILSVTISIGVASCQAHGPSIDEVIKAADTALYEAKRNGRDRVAVAGSC